MVPPARIELALPHGNWILIQRVYQFRHRGTAAHHRQDHRLVNGSCRISDSLYINDQKIRTSSWRIKHVGKARGSAALGRYRRHVHGYRFGSRGPSSRTAKVLTTPAAPEEGVINGVEAALAEAGLNASALSLVLHGTTLATNAILERKGAKTAFVTTEGFRDVLEIGYESRYDQYDIMIEKPAPWCRGNCACPWRSASI